MSASVEVVRGHWKVRDGKIAYFREYADTAAVNAAFA